MMLILLFVNNFTSVRIRVQRFMLNTDPDPFLARILMTKKLKKNYS
jgi:hypothetical protein